MPKIFFYHTPELTPTDSIPDCAIAVDVLRATTTIATVLDLGAEAVQVFSDIDKLMIESEKWLPEKRMRAGERGGAKVEGCEYGNSPLEYTSEGVKGRRLFLSTSNGTRALQRVEAAPVLLTSALVNRQAVVDYLVAQQPETIAIVGSGWLGSYSLEDSVCAGAVAHRFLEMTSASLKDLAGNDETIAAISLYQQWQDRLEEFMYLASHGQRLERLQCYEDLAYCAKLDILNVLPIQKEPGVLVKAERS
ncbi:MAG TPA: 2-phosphosulfolactate phosphatase family protein [Oscillatoriales cyanobacterium M59_W2019_021]|nr:MAG: 2-phosphosulfolactate phosphatase family protein [Cyanobacteria bacterium J055]HIK31528.1 2-phosphosulfolactate phosphatase family protein [Oscillatoriales cyanobacterium M4454_W2019_049]HIK49938.1 2-phosphosulfolactate phosphatase family protein [Oscillatoriales cyanobacterium M59_W2019_021]